MDIDGDMSFKKFFEKLDNATLVKNGVLTFEDYPSVTSDPKWMFLLPLESLKLGLSNGIYNGICFINFGWIFVEILL